jgi:hypothetical protein
MYNYEVTPPTDVWEAIAIKLDADEATFIPITKKRNNTFYYIAAASVILILFSLFFFKNQSSKPVNDQLVTELQTNNTKKDTVMNTTVIMTVPVEERISEKDRGANSPATNKYKRADNQTQNKKTQKPDPTDNIVVAGNTPMPRYITIEGPQGKPVKVSAKMASLIDSSGSNVTSKPIWNKKINEWREIMKVNTLGPTTGNFLDIVELTKALKD